jgi:aminoglycoside 2''-phosphotransferase
MELEHYLGRIRAVAPALPIRAVRRIDTGQFSEVLVLNEDLVFRFPRFATGARALAREVAILHGIQPFVTLAVPEPIYHHLDSGSAGQAFIGYRLIPGEPLSATTLAGIAEAGVLDRLARQLITFLRALHGVPVAAAVAYPLPVRDHHATWRALYEQVQTQLYSHMRPGARRQVRHHFETYLADQRTATLPLVLAHRDFGTSNLLFDPRRGAMTGVIDFSAAGLHDPALDYAALFASCGAPFQQRLIALAPELEPMLDRMQFYRGTFALQEALYGIEHDDRGAFERGIAGYR